MLIQTSGKDCGGGEGHTKEVVIVARKAEEVAVVTNESLEAPSQKGIGDGYKEVVRWLNKTNKNSCTQGIGKKRQK